MSTEIQWTDETSRHTRLAARKCGVSAGEYVARRTAGEKHCWQCRRWLAVALFGVDRSRYDGLAAACVSCRRPPRQLPLLHRTPAERDRQRYATDEGYRAERRNHSYRRKRGVDLVPPAGVEALTEKFGGLCAYCPNTATTWDHIVPVSDGGRTAPGNILPACVSCNSRKRDLDVFDFIDKYAVPVSVELDSALALAFEWGQLQ